MPGQSKTTLQGRRYIERERKFTVDELTRTEEDAVRTATGTQEEHVPPEPEQGQAPDIIPEEVQILKPGHQQTHVRDDMEMLIRNKTEEVDGLNITNRKALKKIKLNKNTRSQIKEANIILSRIVRNRQNLSITEINCLTYATAAVIAGEVKEPTNSGKPQREPHWKRRIQKTIESYREEIAILKEYKKGVPTHQVLKKAESILKKYRSSETNMIEQNLKMKLQAKAQRLRRYTKRSNHYQHNKLFEEDPKTFYRQMNNQQTEIETPPSQQQIEGFWREILENEVVHNRDAQWIEQERESHRRIEPDEWTDLRVEEVVTIIKQTHNWKAPGPDMIHNFWLKQLSALHESLTAAINWTLRHPEDAPQWLTSGKTFLLHKGKDTNDPKNYRPITCLPTMYKIITAALSNRIYDHLLRHRLLPEEQKGCRKGSRGCKDQLLVSKTITSIAKKRHRNLGMAWVDYKKAFDSVPHTWITESLKTYRICPTIVDFVETTMKEWKTEMWLYHSKGHIRTGNVQIKRGIFQGDSLSPLLFCLALVPLSNLLNKQSFGFEVSENNRVNHLFYMDDLKLFAKNETQLKEELSVVKLFSEDIKMEFGLEKCATVVLQRGKQVKSQNMELEDQSVIRNMDLGETYKYLGVEECTGIDNERMKEKIVKEYYRRIRQVLKTELNAKNKISAINTIAIPVVTYSFGIVDWLRSDIEKMDRKTRKILTMGGIHHPKADVQRLYIKRKEGGRGLIELESAYDSSIIGLCSYIQQGADKFMRLVKEHDRDKRLYSLQKEARKIHKEYLGTEVVSRDAKKKIKTSIGKRKIEVLCAKPMHGKFFRELDRPAVDKKASMQWLNGSGLKGETESLIIAAQDQALNTRYHQRRILKQPVDSKCRMCGLAEEHVSHIVAGCTTLAPSEYTHRHNKVATYLHWVMCKHFNIPVPEKYYEYTPEKVVNTHDITIMWDVPIITDREIRANRPDIVVHNKREKSCMLIDVSIPNDTNVMLKETEKLSKYKDLQIEVSRMWQTKTKVIPVIVGALGTVKKGYDRSLHQLPGQPSAQEVQKIALLGTAHILRKVLQ